MPPFDTDSLLASVSEDQPSGPDLEFDADFGALERAAQGKPEQQFGSTIIPAEEPDWKEVVTQATALLERTRDLRVLSQLAVARLHLTGLVPFSEVVAAIRALLEAQWDSVHPQLDPEEDNDPTLRANALLRLAHPGWVLKSLRDLPLVSSPRAGHFSWREIAIATGAIEVGEDVEKPNEALVRGAFQESDPAKVEALRSAAAAAADAAAGIGKVFDERAGYGSGPDLAELIKLLRDIVRTIERFAVAPDAAAEEPAVEEGPAEEGGAEVGGAGAPAAPAPARRGGATAASLTEVTSRADAMRLLDLVLRYYQRYEPSSPLPLLIERARRLADMSFMDVLRDIAPDGLSQAQIIIGNRDE